MGWLGDLASVIAAGAALWAAVAATLLVRKSQAQVDTAQKQNDLTQRELFASNRPIVIPTWPLPLEQSSNGRKYVDFHATQAVRIKNIGPGVALNLSVVLFGPQPVPPIGTLSDRVIAWLDPPLASNEERTLALTLGASRFNGDVCIDDDPERSLFAPPIPSAQDLMLGSADMFVCRLTMTYHDVFSRKHSSTYDFDVLGRWFSRGYHDDIQLDLWDLESVEGKKMLDAQRAMQRPGG